MDFTALRAVFIVEIVTGGGQARLVGSAPVYRPSQESKKTFEQFQI
jgi:hypothetical protein